MEEIVVANNKNSNRFLIENFDKENNENYEKKLTENIAILNYAIKNNEIAKVTKILELNMDKAIAYKDEYNEMNSKKI